MMYILYIYLSDHHSFYNESWPFVFERKVRPILAALDVQLVVHNIAQGSNQCVPSEFCYNAMGGDNADFIGWEQSFNCGRNEHMFELIARIAGFNNAVLYFASSGSTDMGNSCNESTVSDCCYCHISQIV